ncbi:MAG TPA: glycosyltransferase family 2 protein, partial [Vicinamibacteria bacterium]|nr:glycosyltransferase family 2 protein [Vicinamibacteria bacterium]
MAVVIPSLNQGRFLARALESVFAQGYPHLEVVVMDGGSRDETRDVIARYEDRLTLWQSGPDGGQAAAINAGLRRSAGTLVAWLNADDYYLNDAFWVVGRAWAAHPGFGLYVGNGLRHDEASGRDTPFCRHHLALNREALTSGLDYVLQPATFFLRAAWDEVGGLDESLRYTLDWDILMRIAARRPAVLINEFLAASREHGATKTRTGGMARAEEIRRLAESRSGLPLTPGAAYYLLETLLERARTESPELGTHLYGGMETLRSTFRARWGNFDGFPETSDPQDRTFLTVARPSDPPRRRTRRPDMP